MIGMNFAIDIQLAQATRNKLRYLATEIDDKKLFFGCHVWGLDFVDNEGKAMFRSAKEISGKNFDLGMRFMRYSFVAISTICTAIATAPIFGETLEETMIKLGRNTALLAATPNIDEYPIWSKDGKSIAVNVIGQWISITLEDIKLAEADWAGTVIGYATDIDHVTELSEADLKDFVMYDVENMRSHTLSNKVTYSLERSGLGTAFTVSKEGLDPVILWRTDFLNCFGLSHSPDEVFLTFLCPSNGAFVYRVDKSN